MSPTIISALTEPEVGHHATASADPHEAAARDAATNGHLKAPGSRTPFRSRLFAMLLLFALVPTVAITLAWTGLAARGLSLMSTRSAWERLAQSGEEAFRSVDRAKLSTEQRTAFDRHGTELRASVQLARQFDFVVARAMRLVFVAGLFLVIVVAVGASRVAGHLSRQLSRPLDELVGWTGLIRTGKPIPAQRVYRGAPEFEVLRSGMRRMALELEAGRRRALEAERAEAFRESARRFAHELKNPLTPIRFAVDRLRQQASGELQDAVQVLTEETTRLEMMARSFAQFGRLPDGPQADIDIAELVTRVARSVVPGRLVLELSCDDDLPLVTGFHEPLVRAITNIILNAVDATPDGGTISVSVSRETHMIAIRIVDTGVGMTSETLGHIFDPYVTTKPGGTGLGLAIARQTIEAHHGIVEATSRIAGGTTLTIHLPLSVATTHYDSGETSDIAPGWIPR